MSIKSLRTLKLDEYGDMGMKKADSLKVSFSGYVRDLIKKDNEHWESVSTEPTVKGEIIQVG